MQTEGHADKAVRVVIAGNHRQAVYWCREHEVDPRTVTIVTSDKDAYHLRGRRFTAEQVVRVGTWYDNDHAELDYMVRERIKAGEFPHE